MKELFVSFFCIALIACDSAKTAYDDVNTRRKLGQKAEQNLKQLVDDLDKGVSVAAPDGLEAKKQLDQVQIRAVQNYIDMFRVKHSRLPNSLSELKDDLKLSDQSVSNPWGCKYRLESDDSRSGVDITSLGADCKVGGSEYNEDYTLRTKVAGQG